VNCNVDQSANAFPIGFACTRGILDSVVELIRTAFRPVRREQSELHDGIERSFFCLKDEFAPGGSVRFRVFVIGQPRPLKPGVREQIYLIGREALINALRHSEATSIEAEVEYLPGRLHILVRDNGRGIDSKIVRSSRHSHWGLVGMRERAAAIGAQFQIWSRPGSGTEVEILVSGRTLAEAYA